jgi:glycosyltransferase involved in cell wall biosynthesis
MIKIAVVIPEGFFTIPERFGGGIVRAYKIYAEQLNTMPFFKILFYLYNPINKALYLIGVMRNIIRISEHKPDVIVSPCEVELSMLITILLGIIARRPIVIIFNAIPLTGYVSSGFSSNEKIAFRYMIQSYNHISKSNLKTRFLYILKPVMRFLLIYALMYIARFMRRQIMAIAITPHLGRELQRYKLNIIDVYPGNGIDMLQGTVNSTRIYDACYIANPIHIEKGFLDVIYIWYLITKKNLGTKLLVAGRITRDYQREKLQNYIQRLGLDENVVLRVSYEGLPHDEILDLMSRCKIFLYPTRKDVWPLVVSEALSRGLPVVTYRLHNIEYAYGWCPAVKLIRVGAVQKVAEEILKLLQDDTRLLSLSNTALECVKKMSWKKTALLEAKAILKALKHFYSK